MELLLRKIFPYASGIILVVAAIWASSFRPLPPAELTFSNETEIKSIDPAAVTGQPEGRVIRSIYEGLVDWHPEDLRPIPGVAESWKISADGKTYTFHLRDNARWSDGSLVTAADFVYSFRRFLDPMNGAEYATLIHDIAGAAQYNKGIVNPGDPVEVELRDLPPGSRPHARGRLLHGKLVGNVENVVLDPNDPKKNKRVYTVEIDGQTRQFASGASALDRESVEECSQVLLDFRQVKIHNLDPNTVEITLNAPVPYFINLMGFYPLFPVNQVCVETYGYPGWTRIENLVTNGPFIIKSRRIRDRIRLVKNPHYWDRDTVQLNTVDVMAVDSETTALNLYMTGVLDWTPVVPTTIIPELLKQNRPDFQPKAYLSTYYYLLNTTKPPLDDVRVRKALALVIDKREVVEKVSRAGQIPAERLVPPGIADYERVKAARNTKPVAEFPGITPERLQRAKDLLAEAGYPGGKGFPKIEILYNTHQLHEQVGELIQAQWRERLGIKVSLQQKEWGSYLADRRQKNYFVCRAGWIGDYVDPNTFLELYLSDNPQNHSGFQSKEFDELLDKATYTTLTDGEIQEIEERVRKAPDWTDAEHNELLTAATDGARRLKRMGYLCDAEQILLEEVPVIPFYYYVTQLMIRPYVKGFHHNIRDTHPLKWISVDLEAKQRMLEEGPQ